jgi:hypothetical protein
MRLLVRTRTTALVAALVFSPTAAPAQKEVYEVAIEAGRHDRVNVPVRIPFDATRWLDGAGKRIELRIDEVQSGDDSLPAQQSSPSLIAADGGARTEIVVIVPSILAGSTARLTIDASPVVTGTAAKTNAERRTESLPAMYQWLDDGTTDLVFRSTDGQVPVLRYVGPKLDETNAQTRELTYKPFHHLFSPDGKRIVTKGPGGRYTHHRGIYFGFNRVTYGDDLKCDVWHCSKPAHQAHERVLSWLGGFVFGRHRVQVGWHGAKGEKFAEEERELTVYNVAGGQFIEFASVVTTADGKPIKLDGDPQHAGFHFRADNEVAEKTLKQTYFLRPDGKGKPGETRNWDAKSRDPKAVNEPWKVMSFMLGETRYSVLYLDHPNNPKEARSSERDYGRFGTYFEYEITKEKPLRVNYRLILKEGEFTAEEAARLSADFTDPPKVSVRKL